MPITTQTMPVERLKQTLTLQGTDLFTRYSDIINLPGVTSLWVGRALPTEPGSIPDYEVVEHVWFFKGEEYNSFSDVTDAWTDHHRDQLQRERMAEAMRRIHHGLIRPLWRDLPDANKQSWLQLADTLIRLMRSFGLRLELMERTDGGK